LDSYKTKKFLTFKNIIFIIIALAVLHYLFNKNLNLRKKEENLWVEDKYSKAIVPLIPTSFAELYNNVKPSVVNISTITTLKRYREFYRFRNPFGEKDTFRDFFGEDFFQRFFGSAPGLKQRSLGSGFIINRDGYILTNYHVANADEINVKLINGKEFKAKVIGKDPKTDMALIKIEAWHDLPVVKLGDSDKLKIGEWVIAIGNPFGLENTLTVGIVSAKGRVIGAGPYDNFIQTDASINPGNSGGPLINMNEEVIGINTAIVMGGQGIGFAIPINLAKEILPQLKKRGKVIRGYLGVLIQNITSELAKSFGLKEEGGVLVAEVIKGSPAEVAGIKQDDIILEFEGEKINRLNELPKVVAKTTVGKKVKIKILRNYREISLFAVIRQMPLNS
jgi:serine protease Do